MNETSATKARHNPKREVRFLIDRLFGSNGSLMIRDIVKPRKTNVVAEQDGCQLNMALCSTNRWKIVEKSAADSVYRQVTEVTHRQPCLVKLTLRQNCSTEKAQF